MLLIHTNERHYERPSRLVVLFPMIHHSQNLATTWLHAESLNLYNYISSPREAPKLVNNRTQDIKRTKELCKWNWRETRGRAALNVEGA